jgi:hypothetical protein
MQGKQKAEDAAANKKINMAMTKNDSIFPSITLPGGISSKATEYKELAKRGDTWESPIFKLGSASPSSDIPSAPVITRKNHDVTKGGVRGPQNIDNTISMTSQLHDPSALATGKSNGADRASVNGSFYSSTVGFSNQVDEAFSKENGTINGKTNGHTALGANNPVLIGST